MDRINVIDAKKYKQMLINGAPEGGEPNQKSSGWGFRATSPDNNTYSRVFTAALTKVAILHVTINLSPKWTKVSDSDNWKVDQSCSLTREFLIACQIAILYQNFWPPSKLFKTVQLWSISKRNKVNQSCICDVTPTRESELLQTLFWAEIQDAVYKTAVYHKYQNRQTPGQFADPW